MDEMQAWSYVGASKTHVFVWVCGEGVPDKAEESPLMIDNIAILSIES